jgi:hypothetical protein
LRRVDVVLRFDVELFVGRTTCSGAEEVDVEEEFRLVDFFEPLKSPIF